MIRVRRKSIAAAALAVASRFVTNPRPDSPASIVDCRHAENESIGVPGGSMTTYGNSHRWIAENSPDHTNHKKENLLDSPIWHGDTDTHRCSLDTGMRSNIQHSFDSPTEDKFDLEPDKFMTPQDDSEDIFEKDSDLLALRRHASTAFQIAFKSGLQLYLAGRWSEAQPLLEASSALMADSIQSLSPNCTQLHGEWSDGPAETILAFMRSHGFVAPLHWAGFRSLTSK